MLSDLVDNCIGVRNRRFYLMFLTYLTVLCVFALYPLALVADYGATNESVLTYVATLAAKGMLTQLMLGTIALTILTSTQWWNSLTGKF